MLRVQFYPTEKLMEKMKEDAQEKGITMSAVVSEKLEEAYGIVHEESKEEKVLFSALMKDIQKEAQEYIAHLIKTEKTEETFTLYDASKTFAGLDTSDGIGTLATMKPRIGKAFKALVSNGSIKRIVPCVTKSGNPKRKMNASVYKVER